MTNNFMMKTFAEDVVKKLYKKEEGMDIAIRLTYVGMYLNNDEDEVEEALGANFMENRGFPALKNRSFADLRIFRDEVNKILRKDIAEGNCSYEELFKRLVTYYWLNVDNVKDFSDPRYFFKFEDEKKNFVQFYAMLIFSDCGNATFGKYFMTGKGSNDISSDEWLKKHLEWVKMLG